MSIRPRPVATIVASANGGEALAAGMRVLDRGGSALDAVERCARIVEADPRDHTVGLGGHPNIVGEVELDASIMDGETLSSGAVAALRGHLHPITVARAVMERLPHALLVGDGAARFAREIGAETAVLLTAEVAALWRRRLRRESIDPQALATGPLASLVWRTVPDPGTVNFLALDRKGRLASAVSTSGWRYKYPGRVGDSPLVGAGNYCDGEAGAAACTGFGELAIRCSTARVAVLRLANGDGPSAVAAAAIADANALASPGRWLNIVILSRDGTHAAATTRRGTRYAFMTSAMRAPSLVVRRVVRRATARTPKV